MLVSRSFTSELSLRSGGSNFCGRTGQNMTIRAGTEQMARSGLSQRDNNFMAVRILLVDDHPIVRQGFRALLEGQTGWAVVGGGLQEVEGLVRWRSFARDELWPCW